MQLWNRRKLWVGYGSSGPFGCGPRCMLLYGSIRWHRASTMAAMLTTMFVQLSAGASVEVGVAAGACVNIGTPSWITTHMFRVCACMPYGPLDLCWHVASMRVLMLTATFAKASGGMDEEVRVAVRTCVEGEARNSMRRLDNTVISVTCGADKSRISAFGFVYRFEVELCWHFKG